MAHHLEVTKYFFANSYRAIVMVSLFGALVAVCLFYIANRGWQAANEYVVTVFVIAAIGSTFFGSWLTIFRQPENIAANKVLYLKYVAMANSLLTYCETGIADDADGKTTNIVVSFDRDMAQLNDIAIGFDYTKVGDYQKALPPSQNPAPIPTTPPNPRNPGGAGQTGNAPH
jgi:hypothetical protein